MADGTIHLIEAQKVVPRFHTLNASMVHMLWTQHAMDRVPATGLVIDAPCSRAEALNRTQPLGALQSGRSFALGVWVAFPAAAAQELVVQTRPVAVAASTRGSSSQVQGLVLRLNATGAEVRLTDTAGSAAGARTDDVCGRRVADGKAHHVTVIVDADSGILSMVVDDLLCDGGSYTPQGWVYMDHKMDVIPTGGAIVVSGSVRRLRLWDRYLRVSEAIAVWRAGPVWHEPIES